MERTENAGSGGEALFQIVCEDTVGFSGVLQVGVPGFFRKGNCVQPVQKLQIHMCSPEAVLGRVEMEIGETGNDEGVSGVCTGDSPEPFRKFSVNACAFTVLADHISIFFGNQMAWVRAEAYAALKGECLWICHFAASVSVLYFRLLLWDGYAIPSRHH